MAELRRLHYFVAVAQERNFTRAAERLHVAQPALSRQVKLLEEELGVELLHRTTHAVELTEAGEFLLERGPALLSAAEQLWREARTYGTGERGEILVAYGASASYETAPRLLEALTRRRPGVTFAAEVRPVAAIEAGLAGGTIDVGIVRCPVDRPDLEARVVRRECQGVLLRRDHRLAGDERVAVGALAGETLLMHPRESNPGHYDAVMALCREHGVEPAVLLRSLSFDVRQVPVLQGDAVAVVGESSRPPAPDDLAWRPLDPEVRLPVALVARRHNRASAVDRMLETATVVAAELGWL